MPGTRKKILYIEDDRMTAELVVLELSKRGFEVTVSHDGREGFGAILERSPDLVLCDISLPTMSGYEILENLKGLSPPYEHVPFILVTAMVNRQNERSARDMGADDYIIKPIDFDMLEATIERLTGRHCRLDTAPFKPSRDPSMSESANAERKT
jgi:DNA-binding response OmpR family regulator